VRPPEPLDAVSLNHVRRGNGEPLLLLHSLGGTLSQWNPVIDRLAERREVVAVDMPGFGDSPPLPPETHGTAHNLAAAVLDFVSTLGLDGKPAVAGISLGSWVSIECGRQGGVSSVVALCPAGFWPEPLPPRRNTAYLAARAIRPLVPLLMRSEGFRRRALATNVRNPERVPLDDAVDLVQGYGGAEGYVEANRRMRAGVVGDLADLPVPLTIAWAEFDRLVRNRPLRDGILPPAVRQVVLPGCGHVPTWDDPELVARTILEGAAVTGGRHATVARA
jgi:pimeloyl-ACP methyl ester carboxylesterase